MSCTTMPFKFTIDLYSKSVTHNSLGQPVSDWTFTKALGCDFMPSRAEERLVGRVQNPVSYNVWIHGDEAVRVDEQMRNLKDSSGNIIEAGPFNIVGVRKNRGWNTISHQTLNIQKVLS